MSKVILVTGVAGFIGSHVAQALLARGDTVVGLDNLNDYYSPERKQANLAEVRSSAGSQAGCPCYLVTGDIRDRDLIGRVFAEHRPDAVIHLAALPGVRALAKDPHLYFDVNLMGTLHLLEAAKSHETGNFVFASTSSVYGHTDRIPFSRNRLV